MGLIGAAFGLGFTIGPFLGGELSAPAERWDVFTGTILDTHPYLLPCLLASVLSIVSFSSVPISPQNPCSRSTFNANNTNVEGNHETNGFQCQRMLGTKTSDR